MNNSSLCKCFAMIGILAYVVRKDMSVSDLIHSILYQYTGCYVKVKLAIQFRL